MTKKLFVSKENTDEYIKDSNSFFNRLRRDCSDVLIADTGVQFNPSNQRECMFVQSNLRDIILFKNSTR